jgi:signal transduction histidine kinase/CheY-like chemotaxis protein
VDSRTAFARRLKRIFVLVTVGVLAALAIPRGIDQWWRHERLLGMAEQRAVRTAGILASQLQPAFGAADSALQQLAAHNHRIGGVAAAPEAWQPILEASLSGLRGIGSLSVIDAAGTVRHSTVPEIIGQSRADRFLYRSMVDGAAAGLIADTPLRSVRDPALVLLPLGRRLTRPDGSFDGAVVAAFDPERMREFFKAIDTGSNGVVWAFHPDGLVLFREPSTVNPIGESAVGNPLFNAAGWMTQPGTLRGALRPDGPALISAFQPLLFPPLAAAVSLNEGEVLADWHFETAVSVAILLLLAAAMTAVTVVLFRQIDARATAELALGRSQRLEAIGQLTGGVAHDFNNLLMVILGNTYQLKEMGMTRPELGTAARAVERIDEAARRASDLIRRMLVFARRQSLKPRIVDLNETAAALLPMLTRLLGEDVTVRTRFAPSACRANLDPVQLETSIVNLCINARDAMPQGGLLVVETASLELDHSYAATNEDVTPGRYVMIMVGDTGTGIAPENMGRIFEPFFTTKEPGKGTGLGLATVYGFVRQSGGHVKVYSELGEGTSVRMYFPEAAGAAPPAIIEEVLRNGGRGSGETVLLVEDEDGVRELAAEMLRDLGYRVIAAADGPLAAAAAREMSKIDLLFTDVVLPKGMSGRQLAEALSRDRPGLKVLYASGYSEEIVQHRGQLDPTLRLITKPYDKNQLARAVRAALDNGANGNGLSEKS